MESNKKVEILEEEIKLMKGELKQTLASVRDYLLNMELPSSEFATILAALGDGNDQKVSMKGILSQPEDKKTEELPADENEEEALEEPADESIGEESELSEGEEGLVNPDGLLGDESELFPEDELMSQDENLGPEAGLFPEGEEDTGESDEQCEPFVAESELPIEEKELMEKELMEHDRINTEASEATPKVNLLANLINWVAKAKKEIGCDQLPTFLEVYGISGHLSPELKEVILHMSEITSKQEDTNIAEVWSQSMLSLHGILTGGDAPLHATRPSWRNGGSEIPLIEDEVTEAVVDKPKDMPLKLKLVFPNGDGKGKEFCLDLSPSDENGS